MGRRLKPMWDRGAELSHASGIRSLGSVYACRRFVCWLQLQLRVRNSGLCPVIDSPIGGVFSFPEEGLSRGTFLTKVGGWSSLRGSGGAAMSEELILTRSEAARRAGVPD